MKLIINKSNLDTQFEKAKAEAVLILDKGKTVQFDVKGIKDERGKARAHYTKLINSAMENAYNAGYTDGNTKQAKRPSGHK